MSYLTSLGSIDVLRTDTLLILGLPDPDALPPELPTPRFQIGQSVRWAHAPTHDFGRVAGLVWSSGLAETGGYHYEIALDPQSPSYTECDCRVDWAYEADLELLALQ